MRQITTVSNQTVFDLAVQEYGNAATAFQIIADNPQIAGLNDLPAGVTLPAGVDFDISYPIKKGVVINIQDFLDAENTIIANDLKNIIS